MHFSIKYMALVLSFVWCMPSPSAYSQGVNQAIEPRFEGSAVIDLLQGGTLDGWKVPSEHWALDGITIVANTGDIALDAPEWIYTKQHFSDFEFTCEMKLTGDESRNTGVYFRANSFLFKEKKRNVSYEAASGYEFDAGYHRPGKRNMRGTLGDWYARPSLRIFPDKEIINEVYNSGDWNRMTIRALGNRIEYWLNGIKIIDYMDEDPNASVKGAIGFQVHNGSVMMVKYRNIRVLPL
ncbi:3-keto-disaccharide hydrolase [Saccharicrinis sp. 156]|uniref:3-keto-disaccharide hydrolase n=1 Tax=Saccharicrinis sp. 156 TaxID=3417574 RepID=UPI003D349EE0